MSAPSSLKKILVAEDEKPMANALKAKLSHEGFDVTVVSDGEAALTAVGESSFDLVLLDLVMPKKDGWHVLETLKEHGNTTPVIVATNLSQTEDEERARQLGAVDFLVKSNVPLTEVVDRIKSHVG